MIILVVIVNSVEGRPPKLYGLFDNMGSQGLFGDDGGYSSAYLVGDFKYFSFSPLLGEDSHFD